MKLIGFLIICFILTNKCTNNKNTSIVIDHLTMLDHLDTMIDRGSIVLNKSEFYLVKGYEEKKQFSRYIDSFAMKLDSNAKKYTDYNIIFYKESSETNRKNIIAYPRIIDRYSQEHDWIYQYSWSNGKFLLKWKIKNGEIIEPKEKDFEIKDLPLADTVK
jgi:hypothetical protein